MKNLTYGVLMVSTLAISPILANDKSLKLNASLNEKEQKLLNIPNNFNNVLSIKGLHNGQDIDIFRYEKDSDKVNYFQSNISLLVNKKGQFEGFSRLLPEYAEPSTLVTKQIAEKVALNFLDKYAPDLLDNYKIQFIEKHSEKIKVSSGDATISGMKVKAKNDNDGLYFWVIVASDSSVIIFERDIEWDFIKAGRQTERWLHDDWLQKELKKKTR